VICGCLLIAGLFARFAFDVVSIAGVPILFVPTAAAQVLVVAGGGCYLWHYTIVKKQNPNIGSPERLVQTGGLFRWVRHPMYLADMFTYTGLFLMFISPPTALVLVVAYWALIMQARVEDASMQARFSPAYHVWSKRTKLIIPLVY